MVGARSNRDGPTAPPVCIDGVAAVAGCGALTALADRVAVAVAPGRVPAWSVTLDGEPLLHLSENHVAVNDLRASHAYRWGFALVRDAWVAPPRLLTEGGAVHLMAGQRPVVTLRWHPDRPAHVGVEVFDHDHRSLDVEVRYRQLPPLGPRTVEAAAGLGR